MVMSDAVAANELSTILPASEYTSDLMAVTGKSVDRLFSSSLDIDMVDEEIDDQNASSFHSRELSFNDEDGNDDEEVRFGTGYIRDLFL